ncbi:MAG: UbiA-like polyprenyltransferase [Ferruginibacter sp.]
MSTVKHYLSLVKFSHTIFALPFAIIGFFLGLQQYAADHLLTNQISETPFALFSAMPAKEWLVKFLLVLVCMVNARSAAMAFNRYLDRHFDAQNPRTAIREIPAGIIASESALRFVIGNSLIFILATYFINTICFFLSPVALFVILFYSYTKRFTALCHVVLGVGLSLAPIGAYLAITGYFAWLPILFSLTVLCWVSGFDIIYALQDEQFDRSQQLHSIPVALGKVKALKVSELLHVLSAVFVCTAGYLGSFGILYWCGVAVFIGMLIYQHRLVKPNDLSKVNIAFMTANGIASVVFAVFVLLDIFI